MNFSMVNIIAGLLFGGIGFAAFIYGKKESNLKPMVIGVALMIYPYFVESPIFVYAIGAALTAALFIFRD